MIGFAVAAEYSFAKEILRCHLNLTCSETYQKVGKQNKRMSKVRSKLGGVWRTRERISTQ